MIKKSSTCIISTIRRFYRAEDELLIQPVTVPFQKKDFTPIAPGDLVEIYSLDSTELQLGIVRGVLPGTNDQVSHNTFQVYTRINPCSLTRPFFIRFRIPGLIPSADAEEQVLNMGPFLNEFERRAFTEYEEHLKKFKAFVQLRSRYPGIGLDRLIYLEDFGQQIFRSEPNIYQQYAAHYFLSRKECIYRDVFNLQNNSYFMQPEYVRETAKKAMELASKFPKKVRNLHSKLMAGGIYQLSRDDQTLLDFCLHYSLSNPIDNQKPGMLMHLRLVRMVLGSVRNEADIFNKLIQLPCFRMSTSPTLFQAGAFQSEERTFERLNFHIVAASYGNKLQDVTQPVYTIDDPETVEVDDGVSLEGEDTIQVHIADPCMIVGKNSRLDHVARYRVTNVYLPEKTIPMLPWDIAKTASLDPGAPRRALTFSIKLKENGDIQDFRIRSSILHDIQRCSYSQLDSILDSRSHENAHFSKLFKLAQRHLEFRKSQGHQPFVVPRARVRVKDGEIIVKQEDVSSLSNLLVSECMVMTGRACAMQLMEHNLPAPFRYHLDPNVSLPKNATFADVMRLLENMSPAAIDISPRRHWAMGLDAYVKASSPLRRYLDLVAHRQLHSLISGNKSLAYNAKDLTDFIPMVYRHENYVKRIQRYAQRFWINLNLSRMLAKGPVFLEGTVLAVDQTSGIMSIFLDYPALLVYQARVIDRKGGNAVYSLEVGYTGKFRLMEINVLRGHVNLLQAIE